MNYAGKDAALAATPLVRDQLESWQTRLARMDWTPWLIVALAALLRLFLLGIKPPHFDEGINGWFVDQLTKNGFYKYDPTNYHGPLHFYVLFLSQTLFGRNLWALRVPVVLVSISCVWLTLKFEPFFGKTASRLAALAMAVSPAFVFYGRYSIHEMWLVLFSMLFILGLLGLWRFGTTTYLWCAGMGFTGMILTKETYSIHVGCAAVAGVICYALNLLSPVAEPQGDVTRATLRKGREPVLQKFEPALVVHLLASGCLLATLFDTGRWQPYLILVAALGFTTAFAMPMQLAAGKSSDPQVFRVISGRWTAFFLFSVAGQIGIFIPWPWKILALGVALIGLISARYIPSHRVFVVRYDPVDLAMMVAIGTFAIVIFYSGTFLHWSGVKDIYEAYAAWFATGHEGHGHEKPWDYWLRLIGRYEFPVILGLILCLFCHRFKTTTLRYLAIYGVGTLMAYSIVRYKTPWCIVSFVWPFFLTFGAAALLVPLKLRPSEYLASVVLLCLSAGLTFWLARWHNYNFVWPFLFICGAGLLLVCLAYRPALNMLMAVSLGASLGSTIWLNYFRCTTETEPYVYVQTYNDIDKLTRPLLALAKRNPIFYQLTGHIIRTSSYPLPWILGDFAHVGYYENKGLPQAVDGDFLLVESDRIGEVEEKLHNSYFTMPMTIRPYQDSSKIYFDAKKFKEFFPNRSPDLIGKGPG